MSGRGGIPRRTAIAALLACTFPVACGGGEKVAVEPETAPVAAPEPDHCDPLPSPGTPCEHEHGYCVITMGEPCGYSSAIWCRDGVWEIEEEVNLCDEDG